MKTQLRTILMLGAAIAGLEAASRLHLREQAAAHFPLFKLDQELFAHLPWFKAAIVVWALLSVYWEIAATKASAATSSESSGARAFHVVVTNLGIILILAPLYGMGRLWPVWIPLMAAGVIIEAMGAGIALWGRHALGRNWSGRIAINKGHVLIRSGPYKVVRHPIYTGLLIMSIGAAMVTGERLAVVGLIVVFFAYWRKVRLEETKLSLAFGPEYEVYRRETWVLLPGVF